MNIMPNIRTKLVRSTRKGFTLLESLLVLFVISWFAISLSGSVSRIFREVKEQVFFWDFEHLYQDSQQLALSSQQPVQLCLEGQTVSNGYQTIQLPDSVRILTEQQLEFDKKGGNSSLAKVQFAKGERVVSYQLYMGSGRYKKTEK